MNDHMKSYIIIVDDKLRIKGGPFDGFIITRFEHDNDDSYERANFSIHVSKTSSVQGQTVISTSKIKLPVYKVAEAILSLVK